ncbi:peptide chain release factor N(5)-glutamine methyltransferase [Streptococcus sp. zg-JUN1979]|uniref:peptide chain release factor N(5)-glutamine methyltransferase n=1 Tax=Streptococcus sp. zg-JUN1979 TaxID=3391450 RepID=UPI0039A41888
MNYAQAFSTYEKQLDLLGEEKESLAFTFKALKKWTTLDYLLHQNQPISLEDKTLLDEIYKQLAAHKPAQYIIGQAEFCGLSFTVDERVLIPRAETQELVELILSENDTQTISLLDIGTGSGAIALSLKANRPDWQIKASDISAEALQVAQTNAARLDVDVTFIQSDLYQAITGQFDIIVSNPPYISYDDKEEVGTNVLLSEPHLALFAKEDGYAIYRQLIQKASHHLKPQGKIYVEIGYKQGDYVKTLFQESFPQAHVRVIKDMFGHDRMVVMANG